MKYKIVIQVWKSAEQYCRSSSFSSIKLLRMKDYVSSFSFFPSTPGKKVLSLFKTVISEERIHIHGFEHMHALFTTLNNILLVIVRHCYIKLSMKAFYMQEVSKHSRILHRDCKEKPLTPVLQSSPHEQHLLQGLKFLLSFYCFNITLSTRHWPPQKKASFLKKKKSSS